MKGPLFTAHEESRTHRLRGNASLWIRWRAKPRGCLATPRTQCAMRWRHLPVATHRTAERRREGAHWWERLL